MTDDETARRIAENESVFRRANEQIERSAEAMPGLVAIPFICECPDPTCTEIIQLTFDEYEHIRSDPHWFVSMPGHQEGAVEQGAARIAARNERYEISEKVGAAAEEAERQLDEPAERA